jgi:hypothetical protein
MLRKLPAPPDNGNSRMLISRESRHFCIEMTNPALCAARARAIANSKLNAFVALQPFAKAKAQPYGWAFA